MKNNYVLKLMGLFILIISPFMVSAQQIVKGKTVDDNGEGLPFMTVVEKGTTNGTVTDVTGDFTIDLETIPTVIIVSSVGYATQEIRVENTANLTITVQEEAASLNEVVVVGSRNPNRSAIDSPVPIDIIDVSELTEIGPQVNLNQILNFVAPSFTSNTQTISDGTDHIDPASLRSLGPDQVLVLVNGKRRHTSSLINVNGTFGRGSVGTDLNTIPAASIKRIEVLRDGAAAQYGSDAIAGIINIVLRDNVNELTVNITAGANFSKNANEQTGGMDGGTTNISANYGLPLGKNGGYVNFTGDFDFREEYNRMKEWEGGIFNLYNTVERFAANDGYDLAQLLDDDVADVIKHGNAAGLNLNEAATKDELRTILAGDNTDAELAARGLNRTDFNMRVGQSRLRGGRFFVNLSLPLDNNGTEVYSFAGVSSRVGNSAGFYRLPSQSRTFTPIYFNGFLPEINSTISDQSLAVGIRGKIGDWNVDFSNTYGRNAFQYDIGNTLNASLQNSSGTTFNAGGFSFMQNTINLDINKYYQHIFEGFNVAFGTEYRIENYDITAGEEASYRRYTAEGAPITLGSQSSSEDFFGKKRPGGSQVFPGFGPANELSKGRSSIAGYFDLDAALSKALSVTFATRYENYSDFGSTVNFKLASIFKITDDYSIRASANTGFRAPSLHQLNFNSTSTIFDQDGNPQEVSTFANDSRAAELLGIPKLKQETSTSVSAGFTARIPAANITLTLDGYIVNIADRIVYTGQFSGPGTGTELDNLLSQANASRASFFSNAIDTKSQGIDFVIAHKATFSSKSRLKSELSTTFSQTQQVGDIKSSEVLRNAGLVDTYFPEDSRVYLEEAVPRTKLVLTETFTVGKLNVFLRNVYFGEVTEATTNVDRQQVFSSKIVTDLSVSYKFIPALTLTLGANNLLDIYPDRASEELADGGNNRSSGRFDWSRRAQQFGIGGRFLFARLSFKLK